MNSTDRKIREQDAEKFMLAAEKVHETWNGEKDFSFFGPCDEELLPELITDYDFQTPVEFRKKMEEIWEHRNAPEMKAFAIPVSAAVFQYRPDMEKKESDGGVSAYIYEF